MMQPRSQQRRRSVILACMTREPLAIHTLGRSIFLKPVNILVTYR